MNKIQVYALFFLTTAACFTEASGKFCSKKMHASRILQRASFESSKTKGMHQGY
jgi:hypothetical protein